jgi:hypothetical protein
MLATLTSKNQLTLPKKLVERFPGVRQFNVREEYGRIVLEPVVAVPAHEVRERLAELGLGEQDVKDAVAWARKPRR